MILHAGIISFTYALIETSFRQIRNGTLKYTTPGQTLITFVWSPFILQHFSYFQTNAVILFPFNIWTCEILFGNVLYYHGCQRLWYYNDTFSLCNHTITLKYYFHWLILGKIIQQYLLIFN